MSVARRFSLAIENPATNTTEMKEPISAFLVDSRPSVGRLASCGEISPPLKETDGPLRRYSICDLQTLSHNVPNRFDARNTPGNAVAQALGSYSLTSKQWEIRNHQRRNSTAIRFLLPKNAANVDER